MDAIKANELRIGNWINNGDRNFIFTDPNLIYDIFHFECEFYGIELTPDIIEQAGFEKDHDGNYRKIKCLYWLPEAGIIQFALGYAPLFNCKCKYVHQLQNLIFSLTGEELDIKKIN